MPRLTLKQKAINQLTEICSLWTSAEWGDREMDGFQEGIDRIEIRFAIPNGGIIGVSIWDVDRKWGFYLPTELHQDWCPDWFHNAEPHLRFARSAIAVYRSVVKPYQSKSGKGRKKRQSNYIQLTIIDELSRIALAGDKSDEPLIIGAKPKPIPQEPAKPDWGEGMLVVAIGGRTLQTHGGKILRLVGVSQMGSPLIENNIGPPFPVSPDHIRPATPEDLSQAQPDKTALTAPSAPADGLEIFKEWRYWDSTQKWTYTGACGINIVAKHPNSELFPADVDPNELAANADHLSV